MYILFVFSPHTAGSSSVPVMPMNIANIPVSEHFKSLFLNYVTNLHHSNSEQILSIHIHHTLVSTVNISHTV